MKYSEIKSILNQITDPAERLEFVMDMGRELCPIPMDKRGTEIKGCASRVEIYKEDDNYYASADSGLVAGIVYILISIAKDNGTDNLLAEFESLDLKLGSSRMTGVAGVIEFLGHGS